MTVANLTTTGTALALSLTGRERWEVVVEHETLIAACHHTVDHLLVELCAEGDRSERHGLTALEDSTSVGHRQRAHLAPDRTHLVGLTAIHAEPLVEDAAAHGVAQHIVPVASCLSVLLFEILLREISVSSVVLLEEVGQDLVEGIVALLLRQRLVDGIVGGLIELVVNLLAEILVVDLVVVLALDIGAELLGQLILQLAHRDDGFLRSLESLDEILLRHLAHLTFHHHEVVLGATHHDVEVGVFHLLERRIDDVLAVDASHAALRDRMLERNRRAGHGSRSCETS